MGWAVVQCEPSRESVVRLQLMRQKFTTYAPRIRLRHGKTAKLFPGYVFVWIERRWYEILWTIGVLRILMSGDRPAELPTAVVDEIKSREGRDGFVKLPPRRRPRRGQRVRVVAGSFAGCIGLYESTTSEERERILLEVLGCARRVDLPTGYIEASAAQQDVASSSKLRY